MQHQVVSIENVPLSFQVAGLGSRFVAWLLDFVVIVGLFLVSMYIGAAYESARQGFGIAIVMLLTFAVQWGYFLLFEWLWHGQTPGKRMVGIRVIDLQGASISFGQSAMRNLLRVVDGLPLVIPDVVPVMYGFGFLAAATNPEQRRLGDLAAGTLVVRVGSSSAPLAALQREFGGPVQKTQALRTRLEQLTREQKDTLVDLCLRRDQLRVRERSRLFAAVADYFRERWKMAPATHQSEEKFVMEIAAALTADLFGQVPASSPQRVPR
jgi:uncharacterized RDD family membrane protein YckC